MKLFAVVVIFVSVSIAFAAEDSPRPTPSIGEAKQKIEEAQLDKAKSQENQPVVRVIKIKTVASQGDADYKTDEEKTNSDKPRDYTLLLSVLTAIFTGALVITGVLQYCVYKAQAKIMRRQLKAARLSAEASQKSAVAATESAQVARDALEVVERPSLSPEKWELDIGGNANRRPDGLICTLRNVGRIPAQIIEGAVGFVSWEKTSLPLLIANPEVTQEGLFTAYSQGVLDYVLPFDAEEYWLRRKEGGPHNRMYFYGYVLYADEFNNLHRLRFCLVEMVTPVPVKEGGYNYTDTTKKQKEKRPV